MTALKEKSLKKGINGNSVREPEIVYMQFREGDGIRVYSMRLDKDGHEIGLNYTGITLESDGYLKQSELAEIVRNSGKNDS